MSIYSFNKPLFLAHQHTLYPVRVGSQCDHLQRLWEPASGSSDLSSPGSLWSVQCQVPARAEDQPDHQKLTQNNII